MINLYDRRRGFESKWAHDAEIRFKVEAKRNRALGLWAAGEKGHVCGATGAIVKWFSV